MPNLLHILCVLLCDNNSANARAPILSSAGGIWGVLFVGVLFVVIGPYWPAVNNRFVILVSETLDSWRRGGWCLGGKNIHLALSDIFRTRMTNSKREMTWTIRRTWGGRRNIWGCVVHTLTCVIRTFRANRSALASVWEHMCAKVVQMAPGEKFGYKHRHTHSRIESKCHRTRVARVCGGSQEIVIYRNCYGSKSRPASANTHMQVYPRFAIMPLYARRLFLHVCACVCLLCIHGKAGNLLAQVLPWFSCKRASVCVCAFTQSTCS